MAGDLPDSTKIRKDLLVGMYADLRQHARHAETLRSMVVNFMIVIASVLIAAITADGRIESSDMVPCLAVACVGLLGLIFAGSYTELHERNRLRALHFRNTLDREFLATPEPTVAQLIKESDAPHEAGQLYRWTRGLTGSTQRFWFVLPGLVLIAGASLTAVAA
jgi:hypothetical protein